MSEQVLGPHALKEDPACCNIHLTTVTENTVCVGVSVSHLRVSSHTQNLLVLVYMMGEVFPDEAVCYVLSGLVFR